jgi:sulfoxide reductase heme-binding subunit YedZ
VIIIINWLKKISNSTPFLWLLLSLPLAIILVQYLTESIFYGEFVHATGVYSARLLIITMAITPLRLAWPGSHWSKWLIQRRRYFGVAMFAYAVPHLLAYVVKIGAYAGVLDEAADAGMWTGWLAFLLFIPLALTSNNISVRKLGRKWKKLHRLVYFAAALTFIHWLLVAFNPLAGMIHVGILVALESYRVYATRRTARKDRK